MGGTVAVTLRLENGEEFRMRRWTNSLPWFFNSTKFFSKDRSHINEYLKQWFEMKKDWEKNKESESFEFNMTKCYSPYPAPLAPAGYGIVVFDFQKNAIISCQGYTSFNKSYVRKHDPEELAEQKLLFDQGRFKTYTSWEDKDNEEHDCSGKPFEFFKDSGAGMSVFMDTSPFTVHEIPDDNKGFLLAKQEIKNLGFVLSADDELCWDDFLKDQEE